MFGRRQPAEVTPAPGSGGQAPATPPAKAAPATAAPTPINQAANEKRVQAAKAVFARIQVALLDRIDASAAAKL